MDERHHRLLRQLPSVEEMLGHFQHDPHTFDIPRSVMLKAIRSALEHTRQQLLKLQADTLPENVDRSSLLAQISEQMERYQQDHLIPLINATGVIIHTNLGRSPLAKVVIEHISEVSAHYSNLEYSLSAGKRGSRHDHLEYILTELTGAPAALVVNNNAGAVFLTLNTMARGREVIVSRGQLVEIGGSFRMPDVMQASGAILREVGATNKTHLFDYENAISPETAMLLKVHTSNYRITGFTQEVPLAELVPLGKRYHLPVVEDLGSGCILDLSRYGLDKEPTVTEALQLGPDLVLFSGDKLLGGPQAGIIIGDKTWVDKLKRNPLTRALRPDKLTLAGLEATLRLYRDEEEAIKFIPTLRMITQPLAEIKRRSQSLARRLRRRLPSDNIINIIPTLARVGGGSLPQTELPSCALSVTNPAWPPHKLDEALRAANPPVVARVEHQMLLLDVRTILPEDENNLITALTQICHGEKK
jgi:L-seryl-tRNA(Ser) seleniumtransferase